MWRMSSRLWCCPRQKLRMTENFTIPSLQPSSLPSNIQKTMSSSFQYLFMCCFLLEFHLRTILAIRAGTLPVTAQLLPSFLFPDDHVYDPNDISLNVLRGHVIIRVFQTSFFLLFQLQLSLGRKASFPRPIHGPWGTWCSPWKTRKCILMRFDIHDPSYHSVCCHTGIYYCFFFSSTSDIWCWIGTLCYEFDGYMG